MNETISDLNHLLAFKYVAQTLSFRKAAANMRIPVSTLSRRIASLETQLKIQLFNRTTRNVWLTDEGKRLLEKISRPINELRSATQFIEEAKDEYSGVVKIATTYTLAETNILPILGTIREKWPNIKIVLALSEEIIDIREENVSFALRAGKVRDKSLIARKVCTQYIINYTTPEHLKRSTSPLFVYREEMDEENRAIAEMKDMRLLKQIVLAGHGEAFLPDALCASEEADGRLVRRPGYPAYKFNIYTVFNSRKFMPKRTRVVLDELIDFAKSQTRLQKSILQNPQTLKSANN